MDRKSECEKSGSFRVETGTSRESPTSGIIIQGVVIVPVNAMREIVSCCSSTSCCLEKRG